MDQSTDEKNPNFTATTAMKFFCFWKSALLFWTNCVTLWRDNDVERETEHRKRFNVEKERKIPVQTNKYLMNSMKIKSFSIECASMLVFIVVFVVVFTMKRHSNFLTSTKNSIAFWHYSKQVKNICISLNVNKIQCVFSFFASLSCQMRLNRFQAKNKQIYLFPSFDGSKNDHNFCFLSVLSFGFEKLWRKKRNLVIFSSFFFWSEQKMNMNGSIQ